MNDVYIKAVREHSVLELQLEKYGIDTKALRENESKVELYLDSLQNLRNWEELLALPERIG